MITLEDFLNLAMDDFYKINIYDGDKEEEIYTQESVDEIIDDLQDNDIDTLFRDVQSWDINENKELTINI